jgi:hypothetical protein
MITTTKFNKNVTNEAYYNFPASVKKSTILYVSEEDFINNPTPIFKDFSPTLANFITNISYKWWTS